MQGSIWKSIGSTLGSSKGGSTGDVAREAMTKSIGSYRGTLAYVTHINTKQCVLTKQDLIELNMVTLYPSSTELQRIHWPFIKLWMILKT